MNTKNKIIFVTIMLLLVSVVVTGSNKSEKLVIDKKIARQEQRSENNIKDEPIVIQELVEESMTEVQTIQYFENSYQKVEEYVNLDNFESVKDKLNDIFISTVDFVFYGKEINGVTFNDLTEETKMQILKILEKIDNAIETKKPGYKVVIKDKSSYLYENISEKVSQGLSYTDDFLEEKIGEQRYQNIKDATSEFSNDVKEITVEAYEGAKELTKKGISSIKKWYEDKRDS